MVYFSQQSGEGQLLEFEKCRLRGEVGRSFSHLSLALLLSPHHKQHYYSTFLEIFGWFLEYFLFGSTT